MRKRYTFLITILLVAVGLSCGSDDGNENATSTLVVYKVDYVNHAFEGGATLAPRQVPPPLFTEIPLEIEKEAPTIDLDGGISINYGPNLDAIFTAAFTNSGQGSIFFPSFITPSEFLVIEDPIAFPTGKTIQSIDGDHSQQDFAPIWEAVANLGLTEFILNENTLIGLYLYQPNTDPATSDHWDWIVLLFNQ